jgi:phosphoglycerol transferase MdoB-like AlkP superfamily enzyme
MENENDRNDSTELERKHAAEHNNEEHNRSGFAPYPPEPSFSSMPPGEAQPKKQSGLGIASFIIALLSVVLIIVSIALAATFAGDIANNELLLNDPTAIESMDKEKLVPIMIAGLSILGSIGIAVIGLILGIISVFSKTRRKVFGVIGIILNGLIVIGTVGLVVVGMIIGAAAVA